MVLLEAGNLLLGDEKLKFYRIKRRWRDRSTSFSQNETAAIPRGLFTIALSGGSTPKPLYEALPHSTYPGIKSMGR